MVCLKILLLLASAAVLVHGYDNGMAAKPPMGWLSWTAFYCEIDCEKHPDACINEQLYKGQADRMVEDGYLAAGYDYMNVDDCWAELERDPVTKRMVPDHKRFGSGIKALADYMHEKGLKFGIYTDIGTQTCGMYPGELTEDGTGNFFEVDAKAFAEWGVDSLKVDGCYVDPVKMGPLYSEFGDELNKTGRPILYYCSMPFFQATREPWYKPEDIDFDLMIRKCQSWRFFDDINNSWESVRSIMAFWEKGVDTYAKFQGPHAWFDPDMLLTGCEGPKMLTVEQARSQFAFWAINSAPLIMSNDLRTIKPEYKEILLNKHMIAVDQDERGAMAKPVITGNQGIWLKPLAAENQFAVLFYNWDNGDHYVFNLGCPIENLIDDVSYARVYDITKNQIKRAPDVRRGGFISFDMEPDGVAMARLEVTTEHGGLSEVWKTGNITQVRSDGNEPFPCFLTRPRRYPH